MLRFALISMILAAPALAEGRAETRPVPRPDSFTGGLATVAPYTKPLWIGGNGQICGDARLTGTRADPVLNRFRGCGILNPVRVTKVSDVFLSNATLTDCPTAVALADWVDQSVKPAIGERGGGVAVIQVSGSYNCRPVNNQPGRATSEHGRGRAIDVSGFRMFDGSWLSVQNDWTSAEDGPVLQKIHAAACGPFSTVLGPQADRYHVDHFHLDTATRIDGPICK